MSELLCAESLQAAGDNADRALELAILALRVAELAPGEESRRQRLQGYAWAHVGNAWRVKGDLPGAEEAFRRSQSLWITGPEVDPGPLDEVRLFDLEASLRRAQARFAEALTLLDKALSRDQGMIRSDRLLLNKATVLEALGDIEGAVSVLHQAAPSVYAKGEPRLIFALRFNLGVNLCLLGQYEGASDLLPDLRKSASQFGNDLDTARLQWLEGRILAGLGKSHEAIRNFSRVREEFSARGIAPDVALVSLELAVVYLQLDRTREVRLLTRQLAPIFRAQGMHREVLAALTLFRDAAETESLTLELARRLVAYLHRARHTPNLRFEP
jgi:tetratricopeptide (TPR) repeat protein